MYYYRYISEVNVRSTSVVIALAPLIVMYLYHDNYYTRKILQKNSDIVKRTESVDTAEMVQESDLSAVNEKSTFRDAVYPSLRLPQNKSSARLSVDDLLR